MMFLYIYIVVGFNAYFICMSHIVIDIYIYAHI